MNSIQILIALSLLSLPSLASQSSLDGVYDQQVGKFYKDDGVTWPYTAKVTLDDLAETSGKYIIEYDHDKAATADTFKCTYDYSLSLTQDTTNDTATFTVTSVTVSFVGPNNINITNTYDETDNNNEPLAHSGWVDHTNEVLSFVTDHPSFIQCNNNLRANYFVHMNKMSTTSLHRNTQNLSVASPWLGARTDIPSTQ